ncbi:ComEA family DNA-binding protein [Otariodibacter oris]|uniref:Competence protein ComEA n=1 Tax=Otariodibacter oris TaxID=1032623 RepID=A0A420XFI7_9PAST|nr:helix-hairpin-helix domain-containing protein [Otariodibacter oris]QGM81622.1 transporter [Otariodibacter oris]RKR71234.1 competence protein ComEA [Otariodibacter oris]
MKKITRYVLSLLFCSYAAVSVAKDTPKLDIAKSKAEIHTISEASKKNINPNVVNINTATVAEIQDKLVGIGTKKAQAIVEYRENNGQFLAVEQITEVSGIGPATLDKNRDRIILK